MIDYIAEYFANAFSTPMRAVSQVIGFAASLLALITFSSTERKKTLRVKLISDIMWMLSFLFGGAWSGAVTNGVNSVRDGVFYFKKPSWKGKWFIPATFICFYIVSGVLAWNGYISLMPMIAAFIAVMGLWATNPLYNKILYIPSALLWIVYSLYVYNIMAIVCNLFYLVSISVGLVKSYMKNTAKEN